MEKAAAPRLLDGLLRNQPLNAKSIVRVPFRRGPDIFESNDLVVQERPQD
jgi:hypothetical protein